MLKIYINIVKELSSVIIDMHFFLVSKLIAHILEQLNHIEINMLITNSN